MTKISEALGNWLFNTLGIRAQPLPCQVEKGGVYLEDAAVFRRVGRRGKNNLLLDRKWGPRVRLSTKNGLVSGHLSYEGQVGLLCIAKEKFALSID